MRINKKVLITIPFFFLTFLITSCDQQNTDLKKDILPRYKNSTLGIDERVEDLLGRMTIEEKAELSFSFLRSLEDRIARYIKIDAEFQDMVVQEFGSFVMRNIDEAKVTAVSNQRLPSTDFDEAAVISFIDTMCI